MDPDAHIDVPSTVTAGHTTDLLSTYWPAVILTVAALVSIGWCVKSLRRPYTSQKRRRVAPAAACLTLSAGLLVLSLALALNTWVGYFPSVAAVERWINQQTHSEESLPEPHTLNSPEHAETSPTGHGQSFATEIESSAAQITDHTAWVYIPPGYDAPGNTQRYPVVYALHGAPGTAADWFTGGQIDATLDSLIAAKSIPAAIVIAPSVSAGANRVYDEPVNLPDGPQFETYVSSDVVRWADQNFRTKADPSHRIIAGMSAGGLGALINGLHHPDMFGAVVSLMPYLHPETPALKADARAMRANSPLEVIADLNVQKHTGSPAQYPARVFLGQGDGEPTAEATQIHDALRAHGHTVTLRVLPGLAHNWTAAKTLMPYGLIWAFSQLGWVSPTEAK